LFEQNPGAKYADHARGNLALRKELATIFATRTTAEWIEFGQKVNTPICPVNTVTTITKDPQFQARLPLRPYRDAGTDLMPSPIKPIGEELPVPAVAARDPGRDTDDVLTRVLGYDAERIAALRRAGALG
jgi:crotonobetainyl-CoA:carnitine CoA-transferase CaiB-like acyl-CoA transferase